MPNYISFLQQQISSEHILKPSGLMNGVDMNSLEFAKSLDRDDPLASFRQKFHYPKVKSLIPTEEQQVEDPERECIYLCGNSLGLLPKETKQEVLTQLNKWAEMGVEQHFRNPLPAATCDTYGREGLGRLLGADPKNVVLMNSLTVNLHLLLISFYRPTNERFKILIEEGAFPSDRYAVISQAKMRGFNPSEAILEVSPRTNEMTIRTEDILEVIEKEGDKIAVICFGGVQYYTGQKFDMKRITEAGRAKGCFVGWDLAHAIGNVRVCLDEWGVDFACWCTYKYLNSGAGCIGGAYVNKRHNCRNDHLLGWWSNKYETRFKMLGNCDISEGIEGFRLSNPSPLMVCSVLSSLKIFDEAGMERILQKQLLLTGYLEHLLNTTFHISESSDATVKIITPKDPNQRGCQLSIIFAFPLEEVHKKLKGKGIVVRQIIHLLFLVLK